MPEEEAGSEAHDGAVSVAGIHCLTIIGQIEGHYMLSSQNKATKYEHVLP